MIKSISIILTLLVQYQLLSQNPSWKTLPNAPSDTNRFEDIFFINDATGWIIQYQGAVYKTTNGGQNWLMLSGSINTALRSTGFFNINTGIIGTLDSSNILFRTTSGGSNWIEITNIQGTAPKGICGISIVNSTVAYACGRFYGPANVIKTTDAGISWISLPVDDLAQSLVDCHFFSPDSGFVVGGYGQPYGLGRAVVLFTSNGGSNWSRVHYSNRNDLERCWKIFFISRQVGYASIEKYNFTQSYYLKTTNGGLNWQENTFIVNYKMQGIAFLNENTGWIGGWGPNGGFYGQTYQTTNGGLNWNLAGWGINVNRFRFINDTLAYSVGKTVYKYTTEPIGIQPISTAIPKDFILHQNYPNPFNPATKIRFELPVGNGHDRSLLIVYDALGREITALVNEELKPGVYEVSWNASNQPSGIYFYKIFSNEFTESKKMILIK